MATISDLGHDLDIQSGAKLHWFCKMSLLRPSLCRGTWPDAQRFAKLLVCYARIDFNVEGEKWKNKPINTTTLGKSFIYLGYLFSP